MAYQQKNKNRLSQLMLILALGGTFVGGSLALVGSLLGMGLFAGCLVATIGTGVWCFRNWDY